MLYVRALGMRGRHNAVSWALAYRKPYASHLANTHTGRRLYLHRRARHCIQARRPHRNISKSRVCAREKKKSYRAGRTQVRRTHRSSGHDASGVGDDERLGNPWPSFSSMSLSSSSSSCHFGRAFAGSLTRVVITAATAGDSTTSPSSSSC